MDKTRRQSRRKLSRLIASTLQAPGKKTVNDGDEDLGFLMHTYMS